MSGGAETFFRRMHDWFGGRDWETLPHGDEDCITCREWRAALPDFRDQLVAAIRTEAVAYALHAYSHTPEQQADAIVAALGLTMSPNPRQSEEP